MSDSNPKYPRGTVMVDEEGKRYLTFADSYARAGGSGLTEFTRKLRPLIVIDPEDEEQVRAAWAALYGSLDAPPHARFTKALQKLIPEPEPRIPEVPGGCRTVVDRFDNVWSLAPTYSQLWTNGAATCMWENLWADAGPLRPVGAPLEVSE